MDESLVVLAAAVKAGKIGPPLVLVGLTLLAFMKRGGLRLIRAVQFFDQGFVKVMRMVCGFTGAPWVPSRWWQRALRWGWFAGVFGGLLALAYFTHGNVRLGAIFCAYLLALAVGRAWVSEETRLLNGEAGADERRSTLMRPMAMVSFGILVVLIPLSFQETHRELNWYRDAQDTPLAWGMVTADLLLHCVVDFVEYLDPKADREGLQIRDWKEGLLVLLHFMALAYVVVNGVSLVAKSDHTVHAELDRLKSRGEAGNIDRLGERVTEELIRMLGREGKQAPPKGAAAAAEALGKMAARGPLSDRALRALLGAAVHPFPAVRSKATKALGQTRNSRATAKLLKLLQQERQKNVVEAAGIALRQMPGLPQSGLKSLRKQGLELCRKPEPQGERFRRYAIAMLFRHRHDWLLPWTHGGMKGWMETEPDEEVRRNLEAAMALCSQERRELVIRSKLEDLASEDAARRGRAIGGLAPFIADGRVAKALLEVAERESDEAACFQILRALYLEREAPPALAARIVSRLRKMIEDERPHVRVAAAEGLGILRPIMPTTARLLLRRVMEDTDPQVRMVAFMSLLRLRAKKEFLQATGTLKEWVEQAKGNATGQEMREGDPELAEAVYEVLRELQSGASLEDLMADWNPEDLPGEASGGACGEAAEPDELSSRNPALMGAS